MYHNKLHILKGIATKPWAYILHNEKRSTILTHVLKRFRLEGQNLNPLYYYKKFSLVSLGLSIAPKENVIPKPLQFLMEDYNILALNKK